MAQNKHALPAAALHSSCMTMSASRSGIRLSMNSCTTLWRYLNPQKKPKNASHSE